MLCYTVFAHLFMWRSSFFLSFLLSFFLAFPLKKAENANRGGTQTEGDSQAGSTLSVQSPMQGLNSGNLEIMT